MLINKSLTIQGPGANLLTINGGFAYLIISETSESRVFKITSGVTVNISGLTVTDGIARNGGGISNNGKLNISSAAIIGNIAAQDSNADGTHGGGIWNSGILTVSNSTIKGNYAGGGGIYGGHGTVLQDGDGGDGGGVWNSGTLIVSNSTITGNRAGDAANGGTLCGSGGDGGGIWSSGALNISNSTVSGNHTGSGCPSGRGGGIFASAGEVRIRNTIVALNIILAAGGARDPDLSGQFTSQGHNLIGKNDGSNGFINAINGDLVGTIAVPIDPLLAPLANYGGPTQTMPLLPGSRALDAGDNCVLLASDSGGCLTSPLTTDQRGDGFARQVNGTVDIGAFESRGFLISATGGSGQSATIGTAFALPLVATVSSASSEPVSGGVVTFTAPSSGPGGRFAGNLSPVSVTTNGSGVATSPIFTANNLAGGPLNVVASIGTTLPSVNFALTNLKGNQTITFGALSNKRFGDPDFTVSATASSGLPVSFAASGQCTVNGNLVHSTGAGSCTIAASQRGDANYNSAPDVVQSFAIADGAVITFSQTNYIVNESDEYLTVTVSRSGNLTIPMTVDYATDDTGARDACEPVSGNALASSHCDFGLTLGTLRFAPNQAEQTFQIPITPDAHTEGPEMFTVNLLNPTGTSAALGTPASAIVTINDASTSASNAIDDTDAFVCMQYHDFLNRQPDTAGLAFWTDNIEKCNDPARRLAGLTTAECLEEMRIQTSAAFFLSIEFQRTGNLVRSFYVAALDRPLTRNMPGFEEFERDTQAMQRGVIVGQDGWQQRLDDNREAFMKDFVTRAEFVGLYPTTDRPDQYVNKLYVHAGIIAAPGDRDAAVAEFGGATNAADAGARGRALLAVTQNPDFQNRELNRSFVQMQYFGYLRRNPNDAPDGSFAGYEFWLEKLSQFNGNYLNAEMVKAFLSSYEYRQRFGSAIR